MNNQEPDVMEELRLNIKYQLDNASLKEIQMVGYEFNKGCYVTMFLFPKKLLRIASEKITQCSDTDERRFKKWIRN